MLGELPAPCFGDDKEGEMTINDDHLFIIVVVAGVFFILGILLGGGIAFSKEKDWYQAGQESCKVCEVENDH